MGIFCSCYRGDSAGGLAREIKMIWFIFVGVVVVAACLLAVYAVVNADWINDE